MPREFVDGLLAFIGGVGGATLLFTPGYVLSRVLSRGVRGPDLGEQAFVATTGVGAIVTHVIALAWTVPLFTNEVSRFPALDAADYWSLIAWTGAVMFFLPAFLGASIAWASETEWGPVEALLQWFGVRAVQQTAEAWTWVFSRLSRRGEGRWLQVRLRDGTTYLAGFGSKSLISSAARHRDVYLERMWDIDDNGNPAESSTPNSGVWISGDEILSIEFYPADRVRGVHN